VDKTLDKIKKKTIAVASGSASRAADPRRPIAPSGATAKGRAEKSGAGRGAARAGAVGKPTAERARGGPAWSNVVVSRDEQFRLKRNALLREAARAFSARGYHNTSLDDVAAVLGVTKAALYHYVRSKQEILFECHMMSLDLGDQALEYARRNGRTGLEQTTLLARRYIELITGEMGRFAVLSEYDALDTDSRAVVGRRRDQFEHALREMVARGGADGSIRGIDPKLAVFYFMGAVNWMTRWFRPDGELSGVDIAAGFSDLLAESLRSRP
jgi:AcrR family transcriptional regulator